MNKTPESYIPLSRGLTDYQGAYSSGAINLFIYILLTVSWKEDDPDYGTAIYKWGDLARALSYESRTLEKYLKELAAGYRLPGLARNGSVAPPFVRYTTLGKRRSKRVHVAVLKPKLRPHHFNSKRRAKKSSKQAGDYRKKTGLKKALSGTEQRHLEKDIDEAAKKLFEETARKLDLNGE